MQKTGQIFGVSDELKVIQHKKTIGEIKKYLCYQEDVGTSPEQDYRMTGTAFEVCEAYRNGEKDCLLCSQNCEAAKKYFVKCIDIRKLKQKMQSMGKEAFKKSGFYVHLCCMERERQLADLLKETLIPAYLIPPKYLFDLKEDQEHKAVEWKGTVYPYRGNTWRQVLKECRGSMDTKDLLLLKERMIFQLLYAVKALHQLPGNLIHRDLKPSNITIEKLGDSYYEDILVSIIDWDWVSIGNESKDPFADICGGTSGFAHPRSFVKNENSVLDAKPSKRWDFYSAALTIYSILEESSHFHGKERYWEDETAFCLRDMPNTRKSLEVSCEDDRKSRKCFEELRSILQKMLGENMEYGNQYGDIQEAIDEYEQYLIHRHGKQFSKYFPQRYLLSNSDSRYSGEALTRVFCKYQSKTETKEYHYVLAERDSVTLEMAGEPIAVLCSAGEKGISGLLLREEWQWAEHGSTFKRMNNRERMHCEQTGEQLEIYYAQF